MPKQANGQATSSDGSDAVYLATFVINSNTGNSSEWHVYDGETMSAVPVVVLGIPDGKRVPFGFHAEWIPEEQLQAHILAHPSVDSSAAI